MRLYKTFKASQNYSSFLLILPWEILKTDTCHRTQASAMNVVSVSSFSNVKAAYEIPFISFIFKGITLKFIMQLLNLLHDLPSSQALELNYENIVKSITSYLSTSHSGCFPANQTSRLRFQSPVDLASISTVSDKKN